MKPLKDAFADAINRAEKTLHRHSTGKTDPKRKERGHAISKLSESRAKKQKEKARQLLILAKEAGLSAGAMLEIETAAKALAYNPETWIFVMLSTQQNADVIDWLQEHSTQPHKAVRVWAQLLTKLRIDTGEIMATRKELAERIGVAPSHLSRIMTELASINAIRREKDGRRVTYFLNPNIATHQGSALARAKARENAGPLMQVVESGRDVVDDDMDVIDE